MNVRATNGVILACGGFENNQEMIQNYLQRPYNGHLGTKYNTGDGIRMAIEAGADLWHMSATSGPYPAFEDPETGIGRMITSAVGKNAAIFVGPDGTRFMDENYSPKHGYIMVNGVYSVINIPPDSWMVLTRRPLRARNCWPASAKATQRRSRRAGSSAAPQSRNWPKDRPGRRGSCRPDREIQRLCQKW